MTIVQFRPRLTETDIRQLIKGATPEERAAAAQKVCAVVNQSDLTDAERAYADQVIRLVVEDIAVQVRLALAVTLKNSPKLPYDVAMRLARDVEAIAIPILKRSPVFSDSDLIELIRALPPRKQSAIARRESLTTAVSEAICEFGAREAVINLMQNSGAAIEETGFRKTLDRFADDAAVTGAMAFRESLPVSIVERLITHVSGAVFDHLVNTHALPPQLAIEIASGARERTTLDLVEQAARQQDMRRFVQQLQMNGRLSPSLLLRAACLGHMSFVEWSLAELSGIPHSRAWLMVHDAGRLGLKALYERCGLPMMIYPGLRVAVDVFHELSRDSQPVDRTKMSERMIQRILSQFQGLPRVELDYLFEKLDYYAIARRQRQELSSAG